MIDLNEAAPQGLRDGQSRRDDAEAHGERLDRLRAALRARAGVLVREVFPLALIKGHEARIGNLHGERGESLSIELQGEKAGQWIDHATEERGDLITLWQAVTDLPFLDAVADLERWAGLGSAPAFTSRVHKVAEQRKAEAKDKPAPRDRTREAPPSKVYAYTTAAGELLAEVLRWDWVEDDGTPDKTFRQRNERGEWKAPDPRPLYNQPALAASAYAVLVEGEKCADALMAAGIVATSAVGGANTLLEKVDWEPLRGRTVILWPDNDEKGLAYAARVRPVLEAMGCTVRQIVIPAGKSAKWDAADAIAEGLDPNAVLATSMPQTAPPPGGRLRLLSMRDMDELPEPEWLIEDVLPEKSLAMAFGPFGSLKSFVTLDMCLHIALGRQWHGRDVKGGPVVYVAGEGQAGIRKRVKGWLQERGLSVADLDGRFFVQDMPLNLPAQVGDLVALLGELAPALVALDTVAQTFGAGDENKQADANAYLGAAKALQHGTGGAVMLVHHSGKDGEKGARGSSVIPAGVDVAMRVERTPYGAVLSNDGIGTKMKDAEPFAPFKFKATKVEVGQTRKGKPVDTLVLSVLAGLDVDEGATAEDWEEGKAQARQADARMGQKQREVLAALKQAGADGLGWTGLSAMLQLSNSTLGSALPALAKRGLIEEMGTEPKRWRVI